jgi:hypothetical protein
MLPGCEQAVKGGCGDKTAYAKGVTTTLLNSTLK